MPVARWNFRWSSDGGEAMSESRSGHERLCELFSDAGIRHTTHTNQSKIGSPTGSFIMVVEQPAGKLGPRFYCVFDFDPSGKLVGIQMNH